MPGLARAAGSALGFGLNKAFGDNPSLGGPQFIAPNVGTPGFLITSNDSGDFNLKLRPSLGNNLTSTDIPRILGDLRGIQSEIRPGFGAFTDAAVNAVSRARDTATGALRADLARRRLIGSSFGQNTLARAESMFAEQEKQARSQALLQEIAATQDVIKTQFGVIQQQVQNELEQLKVATNFSASIMRGIQSAMNIAQEMAAKDVFARRQGSAEFFGQIGQDLFSGGFDLFGGRGAGDISKSTQTTFGFDDVIFN